MMKKLFYYSVNLLFLSSLTLVSAQFPYFNGLNSGITNTQFKIPSTAVTNRATFVNATDNTGGLQLTTAIANQFGTAYLDRAFSSTLGIRVEFDFVMTGGTGADGMSFYLFDGSVVRPDFGYYGSALGYNANRNGASGTVPYRKGLIDAYVGVGLDAYGNFKQLRSQGSPAEYANGILPWDSYDQTTTNPHHITIRGAAGKSSNVTSSNIPTSNGLINGTALADYLYGYPVLATRSIFSDSPLPSVRRANLNTTDGTYKNEINDLTDIGGTHTLTSAINTLDTSSYDYRKAILEVIPNPDQTVGGAYITVKIKFGTNERTIIKNFLYPTSVTYYENGYEIGRTLQTTLNTTPPSTFKLGFTASTGGMSQLHLIRNLKITVPFSAEPGDDAFMVCSPGSNSYNVLANDYAYDGSFLPTTDPTKSTGAVDPNSFQFVDPSGSLVGTSYTNTDGTYTYNASTGMVTFVPNTTFISGTRTVQYSIKSLNSPYNGEGYRGHANITVTATATPQTPTITTVAPTCSANGSARISNYTSANTYTFSPVGPVVLPSGVISGMVYGTSYIVSASNATCTSLTSANFSVAAMLQTPLTPIVATINGTCSVPASASITNYNSSYTYTFVPAGPSVNSSGVITGMVAGTTYNVRAALGACTSVTSANFSYTQDTNCSVNIAVTKTNNQTLYYRPSTSVYTMKVRNEGLVPVNNLVVKDITPTNYGTDDFVWSAVASIGSTIRLNSTSAPGGSSLLGAGNISHLANLLPGGEITYTVSLRISDQKRDAISNTLFIEVPGGLPNTNATGNSATDVDNPGIDARNDSFSNSLINPNKGGVAGVVSANDLLNDLLINNTSLVTITLADNGGIPGVSISSNGNLNIPAGVPAGVYTMRYRICEVANSTNCDTATVIVEIFTDSDNDGISDVVDLDDDNDGILDTVEQEACGNTAVSYFKEDFGTGVRTSLPAMSSVGTTNYTYLGAEYDPAAPNTTNIVDGKYAILPNTNNISDWAANPPGANGRAWIMTNDHTTADGTGRMALFNATRSTSEEFFNVQNITGLPTNKMVKLSFWAVNMDLKVGNMNVNWDRNRSLPNIRLKILGDGVNLLKEATTGTIPRDEQWHQYTMYFNTGNSGSISFVMFNDMEGGLGNDLALDDIQITSICDTDADGIPNELDLDSDNDGCLDAIEGSDNVTNSMLVSAPSALSVGLGSSATNLTLCVSSTCIDANGVPNVVNVGGAADVSNLQGQLGNVAYDATINGCICYNPVTNTAAGIPTKHGITLLKRASEEGNNWPLARNSAHTVLESNTKGFVVTRIQTSELVNITSPQEGMLVYDITAKCLKLYSDGIWACFSTPTCP